MTISPTAPGVEMHSQEWFDAVATKVPEPLRPAVLEICRAYGLGDSSAPNILGEIISSGLASLTFSPGLRHRLDTGELEAPHSVGITHAGRWFYLSWGGKRYSPDSIVEVEKFASRRPL